MAVVYYPKDQLLYSKDTSQGNYEALVLASSPNVVLYFGTASTATSASALDLPITCSWARSASVSLTYIDSASYAGTASLALTASFATNAAGSGVTTSSAYTTIVTSSLFWITCSYQIPEQFLVIGTSGSYNFTCSNPPNAGQVSSVSLYISNSATFTSSLSFPSNWVFMGSVPTYISTSKAAILSLKNFGGTLNVAAFTVQY